MCTRCRAHELSNDDAVFYGRDAIFLTLPALETTYLITQTLTVEKNGPMSNTMA